MAQMSVEQFANELGLLPTVLLEQLQAAGVNKQLVEDSLSEDDKAQLLDYLRKAHGASDKGRVTLTRRQTSEIRKSDNTGWRIFVVPPRLLIASIAPAGRISPTASSITELLMMVCPFSMA